MGNQKDKVVEIRQRSGNLNPSQSSGQIANCSGLYRLEHKEHSVQPELLVVKGAMLPFCPTCGKVIDFHLVKKVEHIDDDPDFSPDSQ